MLKKDSDKQKELILKELKAIGVVPVEGSKAVTSPFYSSVSGRSRKRVEVKDK